MTVSLKADAGGAIASLQLNGTDRLILNADGTLAAVTSPTAADIATKKLPTMDLFAVGLTTNGYQKLPSGLILQWGRTTGINQVETSVTYPIAFPNAVFCVTFGQISTDTAQSAADRTYWDEVASSLSTCVIGRDTDGGAPGLVAITWFAIGR